MKENLGAVVVVVVVDGAVETPLLNENTGAEGVLK